MATNDPHHNSPLLHAGAALTQARLAVVLLHGRGGSAEDILGLADAFGLPGVAYVAPQASEHTWYPLSFLAEREANQPYLDSALARVAAVTSQLQQGGFAASRIVLAGFSQGACLASEFLYRHPAPFAGLIAYTGGLIGNLIGPADLPGSQPDGARPAGQQLAGTRVLLSSGDPDPHVPWQRVQQTAELLAAMGASVTTQRYPGRPHTILPQEIAAGRDLLQTLLT
ncbi:MAG: dienelactone hydrolase family protein [Acidobacteriota bacterium]|nr:dienelactone hydrolase family protein [Acidobacteriota bacterium]